MNIHPTAIVSADAEIDSGVEIGPYAVVEAGVSIASGTRVFPHAFLTGRTSIGPDNAIHPFAVVGHAPQDLSYRGEDTTLVIGARNTIREGASIHRGTPGGGTVIGNDNFIMGYSHIGHDCRFGDRVILANGALVAGHVHIADGVFVSGNVTIHQFVRIGRHAMLGGLSAYSKDVPPFCTGHSGVLNQVAGLNVVGLRRAGFSPAERGEIKRVFRTVYLIGLAVGAALEKLEKENLGPHARHMVEFIKASQRGICRYSGEI
ncbi:MAG TPA: acyl-ACP--UDP-N-acetylglucosamine O-acyltransferase [bacterium]|nr:acyl-ACP--UDP-N-acetylglucosamine O-acyltransferase [bacterium]HPJ72412.1 acyl-ACP--UDP-N-acetylglucosamine O-acyltransferase [bacterium]HPQ66648.1 acyl-ACP--UDP-N-acetylglucosamine O-acyltransferase [bacterium]